MKLFPLAPVEVFAVEPTAIQLIVRGPAGAYDVVAGERADRVISPGGAVAVDIADLQPGTVHPVRVDGPGVAWRGTAETPPEPPGTELCRIATLNDCHLGLDHFGLLRSIRDELPDPARRCAEAAIAEALAWGAELLVVKGDLVNHSAHDEWRTAIELLTDLPIPVAVIPGNHESSHDRHRRARKILHLYGQLTADGVRVLEVPGARVVLADTTTVGSHKGRVAHLADAIVDAAADAAATGDAAVVLHHHHLHPFPVPLSYPFGIHGGVVRRLAHRLVEANPATLLSSGHTHRARRRTVAGLTFTEVGSTKDYPGAWCGYVVHEGGLRQVIRRVARHDALRWTERTAHCLAGWWPQYSSGRLDDRCFTLRWPAR